MSVRLLGLLFLLCCAGSPAQAASITVERLASGLAIVTIIGELRLGDEDEFRTKVSPYSRGVVRLHSIGGNLVAGMTIGNSIRLRNFATYIPSDAMCASACALAWLGGSPRFMGASALIGFHAASLHGKESGLANALVGKYLADLGFSYQTIGRLTSADPSSMDWMNIRQAEAIGIEVSILDPTTTSTAGRSTREPLTTSPLNQLERRAAEFIISHYSSVSSPNADTLRAASSAYADTVTYFGTQLPRDQVMLRVTRFIERWPQRDYKPREKSGDIQCDASALSCVVKGTLDFDARSAVRNQRSSGAATFEYVLKFARPGAVPIITSENGALLGRQVEPLAKATPLPLHRPE